MPVATPRLADVIRKFVDDYLSRIQVASGGDTQLAKVTTVTAGGAGDGNALVKVTWRGNEVAVQGYVNTYTPLLNDWVVCTYFNNTLIVLGKVIGHS